MSGLVRSNLLVASGTATSRITGLARIIVFASIVGQTSVADVFEIANNAPNAVYELLIGGVLSASLVPLVVSILRRDSTSARHPDLDAVYSTALVLLAAVTTLAVLAAGWIFRIFTLSPSGDVDVEAFRNAGTLLTRVFLVQIFFYGMSALSSAALNARGRFTMGAWTPALANLITIGILFLVPLTGADNPPSLANISSMSATTWTLGLSTTVGITVMAFVQWSTMRRAGIRVSFAPNLRNRSVRDLLRLSMWSLGYVLANQIALVVIKNLATPGSGLVDAYTKAFVIFQLPHGLLAVSIATTFLPQLAEKYRADRHEEFAGRVSQGIRATILLTLPASIVAVVLAEPLVSLLLGHGNFDLAAIESTSRALSGLAIGLVGFSTYLFVLRGFYAKGDTRTPFFINLAENAINIVLAIVLVDSLDVLGLGIAFGVAYLVGAVVAAITLSATTPAWSLLQLGKPLVRYCVAGLAMTTITWVMARSLPADGPLQSLFTLLLVSVPGVASYVVVLVLMRDEDLRHASRLYLERKTTKSSR